MRPLLVGIGVVALLATEAPAQKTRFDALRGCERYALLQFKRHNPAFRRFVIDRSGVEADKFADKVGNQFVATVYHGKALYEAASGPLTVRFICLHGGSGRGPIFVYTLAE